MRVVGVERTRGSAARVLLRNGLVSPRSGEDKASANLLDDRAESEESLRVDVPDPKSSKKSSDTGTLLEMKFGAKSPTAVLETIFDSFCVVPSSFCVASLPKAVCKIFPSSRLACSAHQHIFINAKPLSIFPIVVLLHRQKVK